MSSSSPDPLRVGLIGYGLAGRVFHAPLIAATPGLQLAVVVTGDNERANQIRARYPDAAVVPGAEDLLAQADTLDLAVIATPNRSHAPLARAALAAGLPVVVDKPLAPTNAEAQALAADAETRGLLLTVFHNRRWDGDFLTVRQLIDRGQLGAVRRFESRFERWRAAAKDGWRRNAEAADAGGVLFDLGSHLIDQALTLFGPASHVYAELDPRYPDSQVDDDSFVALTHRSGVRSHLWMSSVAAQPGPRFRVLGGRGAYVKYGLDPQEAALNAGESPDRSDWGREPPTSWGEIGTETERLPVETTAGAYPTFYADLARALRQGTPVPVNVRDAVTGLQIIEAARQSSAEQQIVRIVEDGG